MGSQKGLPRPSANNSATTFPVACWTVVKRAVEYFLADDVLTLAGALTFSTLLSFAPLILLALWATTSLGQDSQEAVLSQLQALVGDDGRKAAQAVIDSASQRPTVGSLAGLVGLVVAIVGATSVFAQLQTSLNFLWRVDAKSSNAIFQWVRRRFLSVGLLAAIAFILAVSLIVSAALGLVSGHSGALWDVINQLTTTVIFSLLFAGLFRYLPDIRLGWTRALSGGCVTALLFSAGKWLIGLYLAHGSVGGAYGAAGSFVVLLVWVYYSSAIFFFGAELIKAWLVVHGASARSPMSTEK